MDDPIREDKVVADVVRTRQLQIVDSNDQLRAAVGTTSNGEVALALYDETGKTRIILSHDPAQLSLLQFKAADGSTRAAMVAQDDGTCAVMLYDQEGMLRVTVSNTDHNAVLSLRDRNGNELVQAIASSNYTGGILLKDEGGTPRIAVRVLPTGEPSVVLVDEQNNPIGKLP